MQAAAERPGTSRDARLAAYRGVSTSLALCSDRTLLELADGADRLSHGIGGEAAVLRVDGIPVFMKTVPLTALEASPAHARSTANIFGLPPYCHYGIGSIGSPGFGVWRELAVHTLTTNWVVAGCHDRFPLMYHWRVLPGRRPALSADLSDLDKAAAYWGGGEGIRSRIAAIADAPASIALFLEYLPYNLHDWLAAQLRAGDEAADRACAMVEADLEAGTAFMNAHGLLHFDAHFGNILTDGQRLYFADFGLALSSRFELAEEEAAFFSRHRTYDRSYTRSYLVHWLVTELHRCRGEQRDALIRAYAHGEQPTDVPAAVAAALSRHAPLAVVIGGFIREFQGRSRQTPYPAREITRMMTMAAPCGT